MLVATLQFGLRFAKGFDPLLLLARAMSKQSLTYGGSAALAQAQVEASAAALFGMTFDAYAGLRIGGQVAGVGTQSGIMVSLQLRTVVSKIDATLRAQVVSRCVAGSEGDIVVVGGSVKDAA